MKLKFYVTKLKIKSKNTGFSHEVSNEVATPQTIWNGLKVFAIIKWLWFWKFEPHVFLQQFCGELHLMPEINFFCFDVYKRCGKKRNPAEVVLPVGILWKDLQRSEVNGKININHGIFLYLWQVSVFEKLLSIHQTVWFCFPSITVLIGETNLCQNILHSDIKIGYWVDSLK